MIFFTRLSSESSRPSHVRFNVPNNPSDSSSSDHSAQGEIKEESPDDVKEAEEGSESENKEEECKNRQDSEKDEADSNMNSCNSYSKDLNGLSTPEIVVSDKYGTQDSSESGYTSASEMASSTDAFDPGALAELTQMRLLQFNYHYILDLTFN
ncbi:unnamed protein product [Arctia plantaginis]|uniref:Uncharacterized protein n=1 Tax=Arctia plantaginis TaxID=874455 RepID=A0A8S1ATX9_ARCPL|nr:unnamed protein product [Arctia plantaginis]